jgi:hypothetical protein
MPNIGGNDANAKGMSVNLALKTVTDIGVSTAIDWTLNTSYFNIITANKTFTFSNVTDNKIIIVAIRNNSAGTITLTWPTVVQNLMINTVSPSRENVYTFIRSNGKIYATCLDGMA